MGIYTNQQKTPNADSVKMGKHWERKGEKLLGMRSRMWCKSTGKDRNMLGLKTRWNGKVKIRSG